MTIQKLQDVLRSQGEGPVPANPARNEQVQARIRKMRRRRHATAAGAVVSAAAVLGFVFLPGQVQPGPNAVAVVQPPGRGATQGSGPEGRSEFPKAFTSADGTEYRRLAVTAITKTDSKKATVTVPVTGKPLEVAALCSGGHRSSMGARIRIDGEPASPWQPLACEKDRKFVPLVVPAGAGERITVTFDLVKRLSGCVIAEGACVPPDNERISWALAVYEWTPPERPIEPQAPQALPERLRGYRLADSRTGTWPRDRSLTFDVLGDGKPLGIGEICTGDVASRLLFEVEVNGRLGTRGGCGVGTSEPFLMTLAELKVPKGKKATITVKFSMRPEAPNRPVRWSVGLWRRP
ncbi:hypothetical protein ACFY3V_07835 [Streptosporangium sp. NPDC000095]|uniref:hypothetical protein n=1 Tax=Streptosporangium sp. NPDC000095 TaxID=3366184 RepID=UPI003681689C